MPRANRPLASVSRIPIVVPRARTVRSRKTRRSMWREATNAPTKTKLVARRSSTIATHEYWRVAIAKIAAHSPKPTVEMRPMRTPGTGRPSVTRSSRASVDVSTTPTNTSDAARLCASVSRSPRTMTTRITVITTYDATTGATTATGPSARPRYRAATAITPVRPRAIAYGTMPGSNEGHPPTTHTTAANETKPVDCIANAVRTAPTRRAQMPAAYSAEPQATAAA